MGMNSKVFGEFDLYDVLLAIGEPAIDSIWIADGTECLGKSAEEIHACDKTQLQIPGKEFVRMASRIYQTIEGCFYAYHESSKNPWLVIRAVDGSGFDVSTSSNKVIASIKRCFRDVTASEKYLLGHKCVYIKTYDNAIRSTHVQTAIDLMSYQENNPDEKIPELDLPQNDYYKRGVKFGLLGYWHAAIKELKQAIEEDPEFIEAHISLGVALRKIGNNNQALEHYNKALSLSPKNPEAYYFRGNILYSRSPADGIADFMIAMKLAPDLLNAYQKPLPQDRLTDYTRTPKGLYWIAKKR